MAAKLNKFSLFSIVGVLLWGVFFLNHPVDSYGFRGKKPKTSKVLFSQGEALYQKQCAVCHGPRGGADGKAAYLLSPKPRDFLRDKFRLVSTTNMDATDEDIFETITRGMLGSAMPPWGHLAENDRWALVYYVRYLSEVEKYKARGEISEDMVQKGLSWEWIEKIVNKGIDPQNVIKEIPPEPQTSPESLRNGQALFMASCAGCHGAEGKGDGQQKMVTTLGYPVIPRDLTAGLFKGDSTSEELYQRMVAGLPGSPMPSYTGIFTQEQIWDLIHYVQSLSSPAVEEKARLKYSKITAKKIDGTIDPDPFAASWAAAEPVYIAVTPLWWRNNRVEGVEVRALHNKEKIAFYLKWADSMEDNNLAKVQSFSDGAALQFSREKDPPFFGMGGKGEAVDFWHWKAGWEEGAGWNDIEAQYPSAAVDWYASQKNYEYGSAFEASGSAAQFHDPVYMTGWGAGNPLSDVEGKKAAEEGRAQGLGSYTIQLPQKEKVSAKGIWDKGMWHVVFVRSLTAADKGGLKFTPGETAHVAFAVWDGARGDRNGQKSVSIWNELILEK